MPKDVRGEARRGSRSRLAGSEREARGPGQEDAEAAGRRSRTVELLIEQRDRAPDASCCPSRRCAVAAQEGGVPGGLFPKIQDVPIHIRGSYTRLGPVVPRGMPEFFAGDTQPPIATGSGRRELANWVASTDNPLTARVIVNRVWQWHFGTGLVRTPNNFGMLVRAAVAPGTARLAGGAVRRGRLVAQEAAPADPAVGDLPAVERGAARAARTRPREPLARPLRAAAAGGRGDPRRHAVRRRPARPGCGRPGRRTT